MARPFQELRPSAAYHSRTQICVTRTPQEEGATPFVDDKLVSLQLFFCSPRLQLITPQTLSQLEKRADILDATVLFFKLPVQLFFCLCRQVDSQQLWARVN